MKMKEFIKEEIEFENWEEEMATPGGLEPPFPP